MGRITTALRRTGTTGTYNTCRSRNNNYKVFEYGAKKGGYREVHTSNMSINSQPYDGRPACLQLGFCMSGCAIGAKWSTLYTEVPKAETTGNFELRPESMAVRINHDQSGKISGVVYLTKGAITTNKSRIVCIAETQLKPRGCYSIRLPHVSTANLRTSR
jgi:hypothetical protein